MMLVRSVLTRWSGESATWHFVAIGTEQSGEIRAHGLLSRGGFGSVRVEAAINRVSWRTSVFPQKSGGYVLPVKASVRRDANIAAGDEVTVELTLL